ncbi:PLP-dependent aminotransferase family protein [Fimbriimonas ginsengisoli]|uniref:GntR family transcriptional regulator n=1 Tax=Fimbriimonas ginsengisoli Gsoil 348 TaxID=661478 RepID=A0A068NM20_FIMGI|nr:PLP-dependent aminotransferase family protein [Fimbriimonas ginsengisoli]AIE83830.1 GntR family transcriptional regulator [Fimbriimonas ginsengisoli Gsoil 348]
MAMVVDSLRLYERLAATVRGQIETRTFRPGDRLPSVRELSRSSGVSVSTVLDAYRLLEDQGLIRPRPQSGYYVRATFSPRAAEPSRSAPLAMTVDFDRSELQEAMLRAMGREDVVQLGFALPDPDLLPHERLARLTSRVAREHPEASYGYGPVSGHRALREQIAQRTFVAGAAVSPDEMVITSGCQEALSLALQSAVPRGGVVAVESPCHAGILQAIYQSGLRSLEIATSTRDGICIEALEEAALNGIAAGDPILGCVVSPNFQNPLGFLMSDADKQRLVDLSRRYGMTLIEDDIYGDLGYEVERPRVLRSFEGGEDVLLCSSFSKTLAPGYRIGWCIAGRRHADLRRLKYGLNVSAPSLPQLVIAEFLSNGGYDQYLRRARKAYAASVHRMGDAIARVFPAGTRMTQPQGSFVLWVELPSGADATRLYGEALSRGILLAPGRLFSAQDGYGSCVRLTASQWSSKVDEAVTALGKMLRG